MDLWICCNACGHSFLAETHAGLVRCEVCTERLAFRLPRSAPHTITVEVDAS